MRNYNMDAGGCKAGSGDDYNKIMPAIHIGILMKSPFANRTKFFSEYLMTCAEDKHVFNDKFAIRMLCLDQVDNVSEDVKSTELYYWARLFKATSWEEIRMLTEGKEGLTEAANYLRTLTEDEKIQMQCEMREKYRMDMSSMKNAGIEQGIKQGIKQGEDRLCILIQKLTADGRGEEIARVASDEGYRKQLMEEYGL